MRTNRQGTHKTEKNTMSYIILVAIQTKDVKHVNAAMIIEQFQSDSLKQRLVPLTTVCFES